MAELGPECACGCGERLPRGSTRKFKRGHRETGASFPNDGLDAAGEHPITNGGWGDDPFTLDDAAALTENDPEPLDVTRDADTQKPIRITRAVKKDIEGKLAWMLSMSGALWSVQDPFCGTVMLDHTPNIAAKLTPILCQSPDVVKWFRKSSNAALYVDLIIALTPVLQAIYAHHIGKQPMTPADMFPDGPQAPTNYTA